MNTDSTESAELDVRALPKPQRHPMIFERFAALPAADSFVLINNHDPKHLRQEFDRDHPGAYGWDYLASGPVWRIRITRLVNADLPRVLCDTRTLTTHGQIADAAGAIWKLDVEPRHLDANVIQLQPHGHIATHTGPDLDVLIHVLSGTAELLTDTGPVPLDAGSLVWLPRRSQRSITAAADDLVYAHMWGLRRATGSHRLYRAGRLCGRLGVGSGWRVSTDRIGPLRSCGRPCARWS